MNTALQASGAGLGAKLNQYTTGEYRGATTAARFSDPQAEFDEFRTGCGVYDLGYRAKIQLTGSDRVRWLNGMVTNNIRDLAAAHGVYAFLLNPQGHILGDLYAYNRGDSILIDTDQSQREKILATFDHYIIMDDVEVADLSGKMTAIGVAGPRSREAMAATGIKVGYLEPLQLQATTWSGGECCLVRAEDEGVPRFEIWIDSGNVRPLWDALIGAGATHIGSEALELLRIASGIPQYGVDIRERDLPQETEQARALNFNKGCYIGQEIVERIRSRGAVHRKFTGFVAEGKVQFAADMRIVSGEKEVGEVTSAASLTLGGAEKTIALGYIRREAGVPGSEVSIAGINAIVAPLPAEVAPRRQEDQLLEHRRA
ncbi:MAG TPA: hypothetical protein VMH04_10275 [Candidatus Solibacter sp.]|nr:hypothetical protein [Candidatus Solibacter sp.]